MEMYKVQNIISKLLSLSHRGKKSTAAHSVQAIGIEDSLRFEDAECRRGIGWAMGHSGCGDQGAYKAYIVH